MLPTRILRQARTVVSPRPRMAGPDRRAVDGPGTLTVDGAAIPMKFLPRIDLRRPQELVESVRFCITCGRRAYTVMFSFCL